MAALKGTILASKIVPTDSLDTYATHDDTYGRGGHRSVDTIVERDEISLERRKEGMTVYVKSTKVKYVLEGGLTNEFWTPETSGSGGSIDLSNYYKKLETYSKAQVDALVAGGGADLSDYYTKAEVESLISAIPETDLSNYYNKSQVDTIALDKVDKVAGKQLSTEDYTTADKNKLTGLSNYTKPASEPISYITGLQTVLDSKVSKTGVEALHSTDALRISGTTLSLYKGDGTFESVVTQDTIYTLPTATSTVKGGIEIFSDTVQTTAANTVSTTASRTYGIQLNSAGQAVVNVPWSDTNTVYTLPTASAAVLGGIKVGTNLSIDANGVLSANDTNVSFSEISGKPTNLSGYGITDAYTKTEVDTMVGDIALALDTINGQVI